MRQTIALLVAAFVAFAPNAAFASTGITLDASKQFDFTDCASGGSASQLVTEGTYLTRIITEDIWICYAATCAAGGMKFQGGTAFMLSIGRSGQTISCRSAGSTGDIAMNGASQ